MPLLPCVVQLFLTHRCRQRTQSLPVAPRLKKDDRWEGEDEDDDVKDNWDDEDEAAAPEPLSSAKQSSQSSKPSSKKALQRKIAEKEAAARRQTPLTVDEQLKEKIARQKLQEESDLKVALESFGVNDYLWNARKTWISLEQPSWRR